MADDELKDGIVSRKAARESGLRHYFTGKPCLRGHISKRFVKTGSCFECARLNSRLEARKNRADPVKREKLYASVRKWKRTIYSIPEKREKFQAARKRYQREHYADPKNREKYNAWARRRYRENPARDIARVHRRRMAKSGAGGSFTPEDVERIYKLQQGKCAYCRISLRGRYQIDHIDPNGSSNPNNLQLTCQAPMTRARPRCNQSKGARDPLEFVRSEYGLLL